MKRLLFNLFGKTLINTLGVVLGYQEEENRLKMAAEMEKQRAKNQQQN